MPKVLQKALLLKTPTNPKLAQSLMHCYILQRLPVFDVAITQQFDILAFPMVEASVMLWLFPQQEGKKILLETFTHFN